MQVEHLSLFDSSLYSELSSLALRISRLGPKVEAASEASLRDFSRLSKVDQDQVMKKLANLDEVLLCYGEAAKDAPSSTRRVSKRAIEKYRLRIRDNDLELIDEEDVVEMYSVEGLQMFRNLEFLQHCRYSLLEVMMYEWFTLYERASFVEKDLYQWQHNVLTQKKALPCLFGENFMRERLLEEKRLYSIQFKYLIPVFGADNQDVQGLVLTSKGKLIAEADAPNLRFI
jgi:hypothetical protein